MSRSRIRRLEAARGCPECERAPDDPVHVYYEGQPVPEPETCPTCGRQRGHVIRVVYDVERPEGGEVGS